jgi:hypothetical protein
MLKNITRKAVSLSLSLAITLSLAIFAPPIARAAAKDITGFSGAALTVTRGN